MSSHLPIHPVPPVYYCCFWGINATTGGSGAGAVAAERAGAPDPATPTWTVTGALLLQQLSARLRAPAAVGDCEEANELLRLRAFGWYGLWAKRALPPFPPLLTIERDGWEAPGPPPLPLPFPLPLLLLWGNGGGLPQDWGEGPLPPPPPPLLRNTTPPPR